MDRNKETMRIKLPRKLKKGCRTLHGQPRTKWQRKARNLAIQLLPYIPSVAGAMATKLDARAKIKFPSGGIVPASQPSFKITPAGESVTPMTRQDIDKLIKQMEKYEDNPKN